MGIVKNADLQLEWIPRQVMCCGAAKYVIFKQKGTAFLLIMKQNLGCDLAGQTRHPWHSSVEEDEVLSAQLWKNLYMYR